MVWFFFGALTPEQLNFLYAAILGAAFNGLLTAYKYLRNRSFDPNYVGLYVIRFCVGVVAGIILANLGAELFKSNDTLSKLAPGIIALLGAYSAEAVRQILDRLVEVLLTVVKGKDTSSEERLAIAKDVLSVSQAAASNPTTPADVKSKLDGLLKKLQK